MGPQSDNEVRNGSATCCGRIPSAMVELAIARLMRGHHEDSPEAARRFIRNAEAHGIDPTLCWGTYVREPKAVVREMCLVVPGAGRTANLFLAGPSQNPGDGAGGEDAERIETLRAIAREIGSALGGCSPGELVRVIQALPEPGQGWWVRALRGSGFLSCGRLSYLRMALSARALDGLGLRNGGVPEGVRIDRVEDLGVEGAWTALLCRALDATYAQTLDCPELCGVRETADVLASHRATGQWTGAMWWLVRVGDRPLGAALFNPLGEGVELVYLGLAPELRGKGLGRHLMGLGIRSAIARGAREMTCAVDERNVPAMALYRGLGFRAFAQREAFVRRVGA